MKNLKDDYKNYKYAYQYEDAGKYNIFLYMLEKVQERVSAYKCRKGHRWEVETDIGPDSGSEDFTCTQCGVSHTNVYY